MNWQEEQQYLQERGFIVREEEIGHVPIVLIYPSKGSMFEITWSKDLLPYRSSMWMRDVRVPISLSFKKFVNWGEREDLFPPPTSLKDAILVEKIDGSTLICSKFNGHLITRTRGTVDAQSLEFGNEIKILKQKYPLAFDNEYINSEEYSIIFEWTSPQNKIILDYGSEPDIFLTGVVKHSDYSLMSQQFLDNFAEDINVKRPPTYYFETIEEMIQTIKDIKGKEGICCYYNNQQDILKVKGDEYLALHAFKSHCHINALIDMFLAYNKPTYNEFQQQIITLFDYESFQMAQGLISQICDAATKINKMLEHMKQFCDKLQGLTRKEQAAKIIEAYGKTERTSAVFVILDGNEVNDKLYKKFLYQFTKG